MSRPNFWRNKKNSNLSCWISWESGILELYQEHGINEMQMIWSVQRNSICLEIKLWPAGFLKPSEVWIANCSPVRPLQEYVMSGQWLKFGNMTLKDFPSFSSHVMQKRPSTHEQWMNWSVSVSLIRAFTYTSRFYSIQASSVNSEGPF